MFFMLKQLLITVELLGLCLLRLSWISGQLANPKSMNAIAGYKKRPNFMVGYLYAKYPVHPYSYTVYMGQGTFLVVY